MIEGLFDTVTTLPATDALERYSALVGLDSVKERLEKEAEIMLRPDLVEKWSHDNHGCKLQALELLQRRPPLFVFAGDVGTGKTELGMTFGDRLARSTKINVELFCLSLRARGTGAVGEMTKLISDAFHHLLKSVSLAQSRELAQMHHEDRARVNALIRGIDDVANAKLCCLIVMCTNRLSALDPAVKRRAAAIFEFSRLTQDLCKHLLEKNLVGTGLSKVEFESLAHHLGETKTRGYGYTFSDITQRFLPSLILAAYPQGKITRQLALDVIADTIPTTPFKSE
jgi:AAA+ superfamily predicted ATPase